MTLVPEEETRTSGRCVSPRLASWAGLLSISNAAGTAPFDSPARSGLSNRAAIARAASTLGAGKQRRPVAAAVIAVVVARITSMTTMAHPSRYRDVLSARQSMMTDFPIVCLPGLTMLWPGERAPAWDGGFPSETRPNGDRAGKSRRAAALRA